LSSQINWRFNVNTFIIILSIVVNFILETTLIPHFRIFQVVPNTGLVLVVVLAILNGKTIGSLAGLVVGLLQDIMFIPVIGINAFIYFFVGYSVGIAETKLSKDSILLPILMTILLTFGYHMVYYIFMYFFNYNLPLSKLLKDVVSIETVCNTIIAIPVFKLLSKLFITPKITFGKK